MRSRIYDKEFKLNALELYKNGKKPIEICKNLDIPESTLSGWITRYLKNGENAFPGSGNPSDSEVAQLKKRLADAELERDILKKAVAIFSKQQR